MKSFVAALIAAVVALGSARADLTLVQKIDGAGPINEVTTKIKGDKARVDTGPDVSTIIDTKTGDITTIMRSQKRYMQMSGDNVRAMAAMAGKGNGAPGEKPKLTPTGKKETINGFETEEFVSDSPSIKGSYWIARNLPEGAAILKQMQAMQNGAFSSANTGIAQPDLPGVPIRSHVTVQGREITSTITSIKQDPVPESEFTVPKDFQAMSIPSMGGGAPQQPQQPPAKDKKP